MRNLFVPNSKESLPYKSQGGGGKSSRIERNNVDHGRYLLEQIQKFQEEGSKIYTSEGMNLTFTAQNDVGFPYQSLEDKKTNIEIMNVRRSEENKTVSVTVFVPTKGKEVIPKKIGKYQSGEKDPKGNLKHRTLIEPLSGISLSKIEDLWLDKAEMPDNNCVIWCEVWFSTTFVEDVGNLNEKIHEFALLHQIEVDERKINFPSRVVKLVRANREQLEKFIYAGFRVAELRVAPQAVSFFTTQERHEQQGWIDELLVRLKIADDSITSVCILDTGLDGNHPLIRPLLVSESSLQSCFSATNSQDRVGHGTQMAGLAGYFDLKEALEHSGDIQIYHKLESVKILPDKVASEPELYGDITKQAVYNAEVENPDYNRVFCMAITTPEGKETSGVPSSWSGSLDMITSGAEDNGAKRLFFVSAGNVQTNEFSSSNYPDVNLEHGIESPAQAWNVVTVGAYTRDIFPKYDRLKGYESLADVDELSPYSSTSDQWKTWPIKPEILLDGGNILKNNSGDFTESDDLSLLTTQTQVPINAKSHFSSIWGTSSATAQAANLAGRLLAEYPQAWPETIRGLLIHSARWTEKMKEQFLVDSGKKAYEKLLRVCGYGVPSLERARDCANNYVNLIVQDELQPFHKKAKKNECTFYQMNFHKLPWPKEALMGLDKATLRVTLSYFIEPSPGEVGWDDKYRYASSSLKFDLKKATETDEDFKKRVNKGYNEADGRESKGGHDWVIGVNQRDKGSIHSDFMTMTGADLSECDSIAILPKGGWWKSRPQQNKFNNKIRYSLIVSLETGEEDVDLYTPIVTQISNLIEI